MQTNMNSFKILLLILMTIVKMREKMNLQATTKDTSTSDDGNVTDEIESVQHSVEITEFYCHHFFAKIP